MQSRPRCDTRVRMDSLKVKTFVYIDVSNIRCACRWSCGFEIDFVKLYRYFKRKYPNVQDIRYYEGISPKGEKRKRDFGFLEKVDYTVCPLWRKSYIAPAKYEFFNCNRCGKPNRVKVLPRVTKMKSNVDVYLTADMLVQVAQANEPVHVVILSCDGDYVEAIKGALQLSLESQITVIATPETRENNYLSARLKNLAGELNRKNYGLIPNLCCFSPLSLQG